MFNLSGNFNPIQTQLRLLRDKLGNIEMERALIEAAKRGGVKAEGSVSPYPPPSGKPLPVLYQRAVEAQKPYRRAVQGGVVLARPGDTFLSKFPSLKAQRGFFWHLKNGNIIIPYRRTGTLGKSITSRVERKPDAVYIYVGTKVPYAPLVIGSREQQAPYHRDTWTPLKVDIQRNIKGIGAEVRISLVNYLKARS